MAGIFYVDIGPARLVAEGDDAGGVDVAAEELVQKQPPKIWNAPGAFRSDQPCFFLYSLGVQS